MSQEQIIQKITTIVEDYASKKTDQQYEELWSKLHNNNNLLDQKETIILQKVVQLLPDFKVSTKTVAHGGSTIPTVSYMDSKLSNQRDSDDSTLQAVNYHTRMVCRSFKSLNTLSFQISDRKTILDAIRGLRQDLFWHRYYVNNTIRLRDKEIGHGHAWRQWVAITKLWDDDQSVSEYYDNLTKQYSLCLEQRKRTDQFLSFIKYSGFSAITLIPLYKVPEVQQRLQNMRFGPSGLKILTGITLAAAGKWMDEDRAKAEKEHNETMYHIGRYIDCFRIFDKMYAMSQLLYGNLIGLDKFDKILDEELNKTKGVKKVVSR